MLLLALKSDCRRRSTGAIEQGRFGRKKDPEVSRSQLVFCPTCEDWQEMVSKFAKSRRGTVEFRGRS